MLPGRNIESRERAETKMPWDITLSLYADGRFSWIGSVYIAPFGRATVFIEEQHGRWTGSQFQMNGPMFQNADTRFSKEENGSYLTPVLRGTSENENLARGQAFGETSSGTELASPLGDFQLKLEEPLPAPEVNVSPQ